MIAVLIDEDVPEPSERELLETAARAALAAAGLAWESPIMCVRIAGDEAVHELNRRWRGKDCVTDVLSFPLQEGPDFLPDAPLGDIILAWPCVSREADARGLSHAAHACHLVIHGTLHLLGYTHATDAAALRMQDREVLAMRALDLHNPYAGGSGG